MRRVLDLLIMTRVSKLKKEKIKKELNNNCEECKKNDQSVTQNLILYGFKICNVCKTSKSIFPI
jgi:hypothetical protein